MDILVIITFCASLLLCVALNISIVYALVFGLGVFALYALKKGFSPKQIGSMCLSGIKTVKNILITFMLIGILTALWRASGTISYIVCSVTSLITPGIFVAMTFWLNCLISLLIGTSFGTAATMGVICTTMGAAMGANPVITGGAVLGGAFFGDRCSPVSTSALLVSELTGTDIFDNIKNMVKTAIVPFVLASAVYLVLGRGTQSSNIPDLTAVFGTEFVHHIASVIPAAVIVLLSLAKIRVKKAMAISILTAVPVCVFVQNIPLANLSKIIWGGYSAADPTVAAMINGGGIISMIRVTLIVCISSCYSPIFEKTGLFDGIKNIVDKVSAKTNGYIAMLLSALLASMISCNQTLAIMLTHQLCCRKGDDNSRLALNLEDTAVVTAPLCPWSIASATPLASIGATALSIPFAMFLWMLPLYRTVISSSKIKQKIT